MKLNGRLLFNHFLNSGAGSAYKCKTVKTTNWDSKEFLQRSRESWAEKVNQELEKKKSTAKGRP